MDLTQNSNEMKTEVETFLVEETSNLIHDNDSLDKWNDLVLKLGLTGQEKITTPDKSPIPFMHMKQTTINVFECLCPRKVAIEEFEITPIPVEILDLVALSKMENYFTKIEIWYDDKSPDPACVGIKGYYYQPTWYPDRKKSLDNKQFATEKEAKEAGAKTVYLNEEAKYLIGKWGDVKQSFEELKERAVKRFLEEQGNHFKKTNKRRRAGVV